MAFSYAYNQMRVRGVHPSNLGREGNNELRKWCQQDNFQTFRIKRLPHRIQGVRLRVLMLPFPLLRPFFLVPSLSPIAAIM